MLAAAFAVSSSFLYCKMRKIASHEAMLGRKAYRAWPGRPSAVYFQHSALFQVSVF